MFIAGDDFKSGYLFIYCYIYFFLILLTLTTATRSILHSTLIYCNYFNYYLSINNNNYNIVGQTKLKSVLVDYLVSAGIKPVSIVSYNHLGNNDGKNLSAPEQFRSKEISKSNVVDDMIESNRFINIITIISLITCYTALNIYCI